MKCYCALRALSGDSRLHQIANILNINYNTREQSSSARSARNQTAAYLVNWLISNHNELIDAERYYLNFYPQTYEQLRSIDNILSQLIINEQSTGDLMLYPLVCIILTEGWVD